MKSLIDTNDKNHGERLYGKTIGWFPGAINAKTGKINPQATIMVKEDGSLLGVFHVKPIYYETMFGTWRPLSEVASHYGNHKIVFNSNWWMVHPRYMSWLDKRMKLIGGELLIPSLFSPIPSPYSGVVRSLHDSLVPPKVGLLTVTAYPDPNPETTSVDGHTAFDNSSTAWATQRTASDAAQANDSGATVQCYVGNYNPGTNFFWLYRGFFLFDTSEIGGTSTVDSATFSNKPHTIVNDDLSITAGNKGYRLVETTPASNTAITTADHDQVGSTAGASDVLLSSFTLNTYKDWALNATGLTWVSKTGVTKLGLRHLCDVNDEEPDAPGTADDYNLLYTYSADTADATSDPKLVVNYTAVATASYSPSGGVAYSGGVMLY